MRVTKSVHVHHVNAFNGILNKEAHSNHPYEEKKNKNKIKQIYKNLSVFLNHCLINIFSFWKQELVCNFYEKKMDVCVHSILFAPYHN